MSGDERGFVSGFPERAREFVATDLTDGGRKLQGRQRNGRPGMKLLLSPIESRHEVVLRVLIPQIASLTTRVRELEARLGVGIAGEEGRLADPGQSPPPEDPDLDSVPDAPVPGDESIGEPVGPVEHVPEPQIDRAVGEPSAG